MPYKPRAPHVPGDAMRKAREAAGWTSEQLAAALGVHRSTVSIMEHNGVPRLYYLALLGVLDVRGERATLERVFPDRLELGGL